MGGTLLQSRVCYPDDHAGFGGGRTGGPVLRPEPAIITISSFKLIDDDDAETTITTSEYRILGADPARIEQKGDGWTVERTHKAAEIIYTAGYGAASTVPEDIKTAVRIVFADLYENRQNAVASNLKNLMLAEKMLAPYRIGHLTQWT